MSGPDIALRWTIGDVAPHGFEALRLSLWGARHVFGPTASYAVCVNTITVERAREQAGAVPSAVEWVQADSLMPEFLMEFFDRGMAEGVGWKLAPPRLYPDRFELSLDNDCVLWRMPSAVSEWLWSGARCLIAEDVRRCFGVFSDLCGPRACNAGIRGLPPGMDFADALHTTLRAKFRPGQPLTMRSELDEQGLQTAALSRESEPLIVKKSEVSICSPFWPHTAQFGSCGALFVGLNARHIAWNYYDRPADEWMREHWACAKPEVERRVGLCRHDL